jgi:DNA polymerase V
MSDDTRALVAATRRCVEAAWSDGFAYAKAGVVLDDLRRREDAPRTLFDAEDPRAAALMRAVDELNARYGRHAVFPAAMGIRRSWRQRAEHCSPRYTTRSATCRCCGRSGGPGDRP